MLQVIKLRNDSIHSDDEFLLGTEEEIHKQLDA